MKKLNEVSDNEELLRILLNLKKSKEIMRLGKIFVTSENTYFYDTGTGKVLLLEGKIKELFNILFSGNADCQFSDIIFNGDMLEAIEELRQVIKEENILLAFPITKLYSPNHYENLEYSINNKLYQLILELTGRCNLRCGYCIYNEHYVNSRNFNDEDMTLEVAKAAIDYANEHSDKDIAITFYGGEPLLRFDLLKWCIEYCQKILKNKKVTYSFTTNLTLVTKEKAQYLATIKDLSVLCSLDGPEDVHNEYRKYLGGKGSFQDAMRGLKLLVEAFKGTKNKVSINGVFTPPYTYEKLNHIYGFYNNIDWLPKDSSISTEYATNGSVDDEEYIDEIKADPNYQTNGLDSIDPLIDWKREFIKGKEKLEECTQINDINGVLLKIHKRMIFNEPKKFYPFNACCIPGARRLYVDTKGKFYVCERIGTSPSIGNVFDGVDIERVKKYYVNDFSNESISECSKCWGIRLCSRCYVGCYTEDGIDKNIKDNCLGYRANIERSLVLYHSILEEYPEKLDYLNSIELY